jgi:hypothetical protein
MYRSSCRRAADRYAFARHHVAGSVQAGDGQRKSIAKRNVAAGACHSQEQVVVKICETFKLLLANCSLEVLRSREVFFV